MQSHQSSFAPSWRTIISVAVQGGPQFLRVTPLVPHLIQQVQVEVKRHLVCKRWTIEKADENSNDTPWFALHRPNSDKLRFHLPSLP